MGNKRRAIAVIMGAMLFAFASLAGVLATFFGRQSVLADPINPNAVEYKNGAKVEGTAVSGKTAAKGTTVQFTGLTKDYVYYVEFAGGDGGTAPGGKVAGYGAICFAFYKASGDKSPEWQINADGVSAVKSSSNASTASAGAGGGRTMVTSNVVLPAGSKVGDSYAAGGGGAGQNEDEKWNTNYGCNGGNAGWGAGANGAGRDDYKPGLWGSAKVSGGTGATQKENGSNGSYSSSGISGVSGGTYAGGGAGYYYGGKGGMFHNKNGNGETLMMGGGGGGSSSPNCYPLYGSDAKLGVTSTGGGYIQITQISPTKFPEGNSATYYDNIKLSLKNTSDNLPSPSATHFTDASIEYGFEYKWKNSTEQNYNEWTTEPPPARTTVGTTQVLWRYVVTASSSTSKNTISSGEKKCVIHTNENDKPLEITITEAAGECGAPTLTKYTSFQKTETQLVTATGKVSDGATFMFAISTSNYKESLGTAASFKTVTGLEFTSSLGSRDNNNVWGAGTYYVYYYATAGTVTKETTVKCVDKTIAKAKPGLQRGTLAAVSNTITYNGGMQTLFNGEAEVSDGNVTNKGTVEYGISTSATEKPADTGLSATNVGTYYLWMRFNSTDENNVESQEWTAVKDGSTHISKAIDKATLNANTVVGVTMCANVTYDGKEHTIYTVAKGGLTAGGNMKDTLASPSYSVTFSGNGTTKAHTKDTAINAGKYTVNVSWSDSANIKAGSCSYGPFEITKATNGISLDGYSMNALTYTGSAQTMVKSGTLSITVGDNTENLTTVLGDGYTKMAYYVSQSTSADSVKNQKFTEFTAESTLLGVKATEVGDNYIWLKFIQHPNIADNTIVRYTNACKIGAASYTSVKFSGITRQSDKVFNGLASAAFEGTPEVQDFYKGDITPEFALGNTESALTDWVAGSKLESLTITDVGEYWLWIRWSDGKKITGTGDNGFRYENGGKCVVSPLTDSSRIRFTAGVEKTGDRTFNTYGSPYGTCTYEDEKPVLTFEIIDGASGLDAFEVLGAIDFAVGTDQKSPVDDGDSYNGKISDITVSDVGSYYLSVRWYGTDSIAAGQVLYSSTPFVISKAGGSGTDAEQLTISGISISTSRIYTGSNIALFIGTPTLWVMDGDSAFKYAPNGGMKYQFAVTTSPTDAPTAASDWKDSLSDATKKDVRWINSWQEDSEEANYYLWIKVLGDENVNTTILHAEDWEAAILRAEASVAEDLKPTAKTGLVYNDSDLFLINPSAQQVPEVEYAMSKEGPWYKSTDKDFEKVIVGKNAATIYTVYYRGAAGANYYTQTEPNTLTVVISKPTSSISKKPTVYNLTYNGENQALFSSDGMGAWESSSGTQEVALEYSFSQDSGWSSSVLTGKAAGTYTAYYRAKSPNNNVNAGEIATLIITIAKAKIEVSNPGTVGGLRFTNKDQSLLSHEATFRLKNATSINNTNGKLDGTAGKIEYGISASSSVQPTKAETSYGDIKAIYAGAYYLWYRVWAGDNHLGTGDKDYVQGKSNNLTPSWVCFNVGEEVVIGKALDDNFISFGAFTYYRTKHYNGDAQALASGNLALYINQDKTAIPDDLLGKVWYALTESKNDAPARADTTIWKDAIHKAVQVNVSATGYYLWIYIEESDNIERIIRCMNENSPVNLLKATQSKDETTLVGLTMQSKVYNGEPQSLFSGALKVRFTSNNRLAEFESGIRFLVLPHGSTAPTAESDWVRNGLANVTVTNYLKAGYELWVYVPASRNFDTFLLCYNLNNPAYILQASDTDIAVELPTLEEGKKFTNLSYPLILVKARLRMRNNPNLYIGNFESELYYVSKDVYIDKLTYTKGAAGWKQMGSIEGKNAGTYHIWVVFPGNDNTNYVTLGPVYCGSVVITKATGDDITFGNTISYVDEEIIFDGAEYKLASGYLTQKIGNETVPCGTVHYAAGTSNVVAPEVGWCDTLDEIKKRDAGMYYIWVWVESTDNIAEYMKSTQVGLGVEIKKAQDNNRVTLDNIHALTQTFDGSVKQLWDGELKLFITSNANSSLNEIPSVDYGYVSYYVSNDNIKKPDPNANIWVDSLAKVTAVTVDTYYLWIKIAASNNIEQIVRVYRVASDMRKGQAEIITGSVTFFENLVYNGLKQKLVMTPGIANFAAFGAQVVFSFNEDLDVDNTPISAWETDYNAIEGDDVLDNGYTIYFAVLGNENWRGRKQSATIKIFPSEPIFIVDPTAIDGLVYNEIDQPLINAGVLKDADTTGCSIQYSLTGREGDWHDSVEITGKDAGLYTVYYQGVAPKDAKNYINSKTVSSFTVNIAKRDVYWLQTPQPVPGLKQDGYWHELVTPGMLSIDADVYYTTERPNSAEDYSNLIPSYQSAGLYYVWYLVKIDDVNNTLVGAKEGMVVVMITRHIFSWLNEPTGVSAAYNGANQTLKSGGTLLNVDNVHPDFVPDVRYAVVKKGEEQYSSGGNLILNWLGKGEVPAREEIGVYTIYYEIRFKPEYDCDFYGATSGWFTSEITKRTFSQSSIRATRNQYGELDIEADEDDLPATLRSKINDSMIEYDYRTNDGYTISDWVWCKDKVLPRVTGHYEIRVRIAGCDYFNSYVQVDSYAEYDISSKIDVKVSFKGTKAPTVRLWLDLTGNTDYDGAADNFKLQGELKVSETVTFTFNNVNSTGRNNNGSIKVQFVDNGRYYYLSNKPVDDDYHNVVLNAITTSSVRVISLNEGLTASIDDLFIYEVYRISYNANGGSTSNLPADGWKWHNVDYVLAKNELVRLNHTPNGWNKTAGGTGLHFDGGDKYTDDISQVFYAEYLNGSDVKYTIRWQIENYEIDINGVWFDTTLDNSSREVGMQLKENEHIYLPNLTNADGVFSTPLMYGDRYILKWVLKDNRNVEYSFDWKAEQDMFFVAVLQSEGAKTDYDFIEFNFYEEGKINPLISNKVGRGASSYLALSGVTASDFAKYDYEGWYQNYVKTLEPETDGYGTFVSNKLQHTFPAVIGVEIKDTKAEQEHEMMLMVIIIGAGAVVSIGACAIYLPIRRKRQQ